MDFAAAGKHSISATPTLCIATALAGAKQLAGLPISNTAPNLYLRADPGTMHALRLLALLPTGRQV